MADYAIHEETLVDVSNVIRKKDGTSALIDPADYADRINLMGMLEEKTVSSSPIVTFADGADAVPLKKCEITLPASLDGYSEVDVVACGKNLIPLTGSAVTGDLTITPQSDGTVLVNGSKTTQTVYTTGSFVAPDDISFRYSGCTGGSASTYSVNVRIGNVYGADVFNGSSSTYTATKGTTVSFLIVVRANATVDNVVFSPMIRFSSEPDDTFEPYNGDTHTADLGRTIYGGSVDVVAGEGVDENDNPFTFAPVPIDSKLGNNTLWAEQGSSAEVTYRSQGTTTPILPTLVSKTITENGTYSAEDDNADGYSEVTVNVEGIPKLTVNDGALDISNGTISTSSTYCYTDPFDCPSGNITLDCGEATSSDYNVGIEFINADNSHANYWMCSSRYRQIDVSGSYSATKKARLAFKKQYLSKVLLMDFGNGKIYSSLSASQFEETQANLLSMNNAQSEESEGSENE